MTPSALTLLPPARALREPTWYAAPEWSYTLGPEVGEICALAGYAPEPEQQLLLDGTFGIAANGKSAAFEVDVIAARRALKTGYVVQCILGWLFVTHEPKIMYTAHDLQAAQETWETVASLIESTPALAAQLQQTRGERPGVIEGNGRWAIILRAIDEPGDPERGIPARKIPKRRVIFKTRGKSTGRALAGNKLVIDEAFAATQRQVGSVLPILGAERDPQVIFASSAGMLDSTVLIDSRDRGRRGGTSRQLYAEWGDRRAGKGCELGERCDHATTATGCVLDDEERWAEIMPTLGGRVQIETIRALRQTMPPAEFAREFMVWWDVEGGGQPRAISDFVWKLSEDASSKITDRLMFAIEVTPEQSSGAICAAGFYDWLEGESPDDVDDESEATRVWHVEVLDARDGTTWIVSAAKFLCEKYKSAVIVDAKSPAASLIPELEEHGVPFIVINTGELVDASATFYRLLTHKLPKVGDKEPQFEPLVRHRAQPRWLTPAIKGAVWKDVGDGRKFGRRPASGANVVPLIGCVLALHGAMVHADDNYDVSASIY